ncbi:hypothetical protein TIFTF001_032043 [Ficus carica]|uniref:Uncharacterized protein n=1 Tax=Ficus carica TaxID=3494 RepID=A0AA88DXP5_FICCA|nr:hypothetical protein TIFTF001_032043 [Ficus carica]
MGYEATSPPGIDDSSDSSSPADKRANRLRNGGIGYDAYLDKSRDHDVVHPPPRPVPVRNAQSLTYGNVPMCDSASLARPALSTTVRRLLQNTGWLRKPVIEPRYDRYGKSAPYRTVMPLRIPSVSYHRISMDATHKMMSPRLDPHLLARDPCRRVYHNIIAL